MEEGKLSRAMAKAGAGDKLASDTASATVARPASDPRPAPPTSAPSAPSVAPAAGRPRDLAPLPRVKDRWGIPSHFVALYHEKTGQFASQMRGLRAKVVAMNAGRPPRILCVTSGSRAEGKTTVSANLAAAFAEIDLGRILLIDGDMLQPNLHATLNVQVDTGLNEVLERSLNFDGCIYETAIPNLDILPSLPTPPGANTETLLHQRCTQMLTALQRHYSFIIIDTPPVLAGTQACVFGKQGDGVVLVARVEKTPRQVVKRAMDELTHAGAKIIGCVLTYHKHHVPDFIYRFVGTTPVHYYRYGRDPKVPAAPTAAVPPSSPAPEVINKST